MRTRCNKAGIDYIISLRVCVRVSVCLCVGSQPSCLSDTRQTAEPGRGTAVKRIQKGREEVQREEVTAEEDRNI